MRINLFLIFVLVFVLVNAANNAYKLLPFDYEDDDEDDLINPKSKI